MLFYAAVVVVAVVGVPLGLVYKYQDKIISLFIAEANKHITTKVDVEKISLSLFDKFPHVSVSLDKVNIHENLPESEESLGKLEKIYFTFSLVDIVLGKYRVNQLFLEDGEVHVKVLENGDVNYNIIATDTTASDEAFSFSLEKIILNNVALHYTDQQLKQTYALDAHQLTAALTIAADAVAVEATGNATVNSIQLESGEYLKGKTVDLQAALNIDQLAKTVQLEPSVLKIEGASYEVAGTVGYAGTTELDLALNGRNTNVQSLLSLLPQDITRAYSQYRSEGDIFFNGTVKGQVSAKQQPKITFSFGCRNASFYHPEIKRRVDDVSFTGSFTNGAKNNASTSALEISNLNGSLNGRPFSGNFAYHNFNNPTIAFDLDGMLDVGYALGLAKLEQVRSGSGLAHVRIAFKGNFNDFKNRPGNSTVNTSGEVTLHNVALSLKGLPHPLANLYGNFMFKHNDVAVSDFKGRIGASDFVLNGMFKNIIAWTLLDKQRLLVEADFKSNHLNFDQLLQEQQSASASGTGASDSYRLAVSPYIAFDLSASVQKLNFRRFKGQQIQGQVKLRNQVLSSPNISFKAIGGAFAVRGTLDATSRNHIKVATAARLSNMNVDSLFYVFENFGQTFVMDKHLRGSLTANISSELYFDSHLSPKTDLIQAEIVATVRDGQLINFEPMQKMAVFVKRSELSNMRFSELHNSFWIQRRTIYMPEMDIRSNLSSVPVVSVSGMHTFDQDMDYKIKLPLSRGRKPDKDSVYGVVAEDPDAGNSMLFLKLKGKESNFKISYDEARVREKIKTDLKQEGREIRDLLRGKKPRQQEVKEAEPQTGEYFDF